MIRLILCLLASTLGGCAAVDATEPRHGQPTGATRLKLGNFSISLAVKDLHASRAFYEKLGFQVIMGDPARNWLILQNDLCTIGLFQGMFEQNIMTFNPGWDSAGNPVAAFDDVREIQAMLNSRGITLMSEADAASTGPASIMLLDPDGNLILIDQHVPKPEK